MSPSDTPDDRRAWVRHTCDLDSLCLPPRNGTVTQWSARIRDVSRGGIQLVLNHWIVPGTVLTIQLEGDDGAPSLDLSVQVIFAMAMPEGKWALGCRFTKHLSEDELDEILRKA